MAIVSAIKTLGRRRARPRPRPEPPPETTALRRAAESGYAEAQMLYAQALLDGSHGVARNPTRAYEWFCIAARADHPPAHNMRGRCLENGWGVGRDQLAAASAYAEAAQRADPWGRYNLANMRLRGRGVPRDRAAAYALFLAAAEDGHAKSMNLVARFHDEGWTEANWTCPRDPAAALHWYRRSAEAGDYRGMHNLAVWHAERNEWRAAATLWRAALPDATPDILEATMAVLKLAPEDEAGERDLIVTLARDVHDRLAAAALR